MDPLLLIGLAWALARKPGPQDVRALEPRLTRTTKPTPATPRPATPRATPATPRATPATPRPTTPRATPATPRATPATPRATPAAPDKLLARANQRRAQDWIPDLLRAGASPAEAEGLARWIGLESSGNPLAQSRIGERGLLQITRTAALADKLLTVPEWEAMASQATSRAEHARIAIKQFRAHVRRAARWVTNPPAPGSVDWLAYAKMNHTRPLDLREGQLHGPAAPMLRDLAARWAGDTARARRVAVASVVGFGRVAP